MEVTLQGQPARVIRTPDMSRDMMEAALAEHLGLWRQWLTFRWDGTNVSIDWAANSPATALDARARLREVLSSFLSRTSASHRRSTVLRARTLIFGLRSTRKAGITLLTRAYPDFVQEVNHLVSQIVPQATYQAMAVVKHRS
eukprot:6485166-Amphidinium_carterae.1